ncbi:hypothetical protein KC19_8G135400, partial [Ceratodon purpureus]
DKKLPGGERKPVTWYSTEGLPGLGPKRRTERTLLGRGQPCSLHTTSDTRTPTVEVQHSVDASLKWALAIPSTHQFTHLPTHTHTHRVTDQQPTSLSHLKTPSTHTHTLIIIISISISISGVITRQIIPLSRASARQILTLEDSWYGPRHCRRGGNVRAWWCG